MHCSTPLDFEPLALRHGTRYLKSETSMVSADDDPLLSLFPPNLVKFGPRVPKNRPEIWPPFINWMAKMC